MSNRKQGLGALAELSARSALSRRHVLAGAAAVGTMAAFGARPAFAKTTMTWMGWQGYETPILSGSFLADNDIDFQPTFISSNEEIITKLQAGGIGKTDLITMYFGYLPLMAEGELLEPIDTAKIELLPKLIPQFVAQDTIKYQGNLMGVPWNWGSLPLMYDPAVVTTPPESWLDILKPEHKGKVAMVDDPLGNLLIWGTVVTGKPMGTILTKEEMVQVIDKLIEIKTKHARAFFPSYGDMSDAFARNEITVSAIGWEAVAVWTQAKGKTIKYTIPKEGTGMFMDCLCIPKDAPHMDLSYKMINHIISPEPQKQFATEQSAGITNLDTVPMLPKELAESYNYADIDGFMQKARLQPVPPTESDGSVATYDDFLNEYQRLSKA
ncbi:ABC transporter substrate-binding protein [Dongia deserti]|uniref:ABC transporter substrate-binding protein n=1 Tax=Dongia deserti TaxID=2268030 RepID=UPI0013C48465|nr:substrate-binding domain-containing protein [Dongia deserti]